MALKNPFAGKKPDLESVQADIARKSQLLADAQSLLLERKSAAQTAAEAGAGDGELRPLVAAEQEAEKLLELRSRALDDARAQLARLEAEAAKIAEQKQRDETAAEIERRAHELEQAGQDFDSAMARLAAAAQQAIEVTFDANGIHVFASNARLEMPPAITMTAQVMRDRAQATVRGDAPAIIATAPPVLLEKPKPASGTDLVRLFAPAGEMARCAHR